jgi:hypothetical protein
LLTIARRPPTGVLRRIGCPPTPDRRRNPRGEADSVNVCWRRRHGRGSFPQLATPLSFSNLCGGNHTQLHCGRQIPRCHVYFHTKRYLLNSHGRAQNPTRTVSMSATGPTKPVVSRIFYGNTINNSETVVQYAGHFALRLANLGLSASSTNRRVSGSLLAQPRDAALTAQRVARSRGVDSRLAVPRGCGAAVTARASTTSATTC